MALPYLNSPASGHPDFEPIRFRVKRFEYAPADQLLRLSLWVALELPSSAYPLLTIEREAREYAYAPLVSCTGRAALKGSDEWMWRGAFAVPPDCASDPGALFALRLGNVVLLALPGPSLRVLGAQEPGQRGEPRQRWAIPRTRPHALRRSALLFVLTCVAPGWSSAAALASGSLGAGTGGEPTPETPPTPPAGGSGEPTPVTPPTPPAGGSGEPTPVTPPTSPGGGSGEAAPQAPPKEGGTGQSSTTTSTTPAPSSALAAPVSTPAPTATPSPETTEIATVALPRRQKTADAKKVSHRVTPTKARPTTGGANPSKGRAPAVGNHVALPPQLAAAQAGALAAELASSAASTQALSYYRIPLFLLPIYQAAAIQYGVPWQILAAINEIETNYGSDQSVSTTGAVGWMQFMPATWLQYGVDALNAGYADPYNPVDAIFAAARYLRAAGAQSNLRAAIFAYNHSEEYVNSVLLRAKLISTYPRLVIGTLTGLIDARLPVTGKQLAWEMLAPPASASSATANATTHESKTAALGSRPARPASSAPPSPSAAAAAVTGGGSAAARPPKLVDLMSARNAAVVAVQGGRIIQLGSSPKLGKYVVLRDIYGDVFTYAGLGSIARSYTLPDALPTKLGARGGDRRSGRANHALPLRVGSVIAKGTVLGRVRGPRGARDGHLRFAIRPAGDPNTIDPGPILANWTQLSAALHPQGAKGETSLLGATASVTKAAHSAAAGRIGPVTLAASGELTPGQWDQLIARVALLPTPKVTVEPSSAAIPDPQARSGNSGRGNGPLSTGR
jgi:soluble lytic murein transglycosylase-like protein